jgi:hypothetical protein
MRRRVTTAKLAPAQVLCLLTVALLMVVGLLHLGAVHADQLPQRSIEFSRARAGITDRFLVQFQLPQAEVLGSIMLEFCSEGPIVGDPCTGPAGFKLSTGTLIAQSGETGFVVDLSSTDNVLVLTRAPLATTATNVTFTMDNITNPSAVGSYFARLQTFATNDASGPATDYGGLAFSMNQEVNITTTVPPFLYFCVGVSISGTDCTTATGDQVNFGDFNSLVASTAETQMVVSTNGPTGYVITANGTTLTSGINTIPAIAADDVSRPGTSQFGMNLRANSDPAVGEEPLSSGPGPGIPAAAYNIPNRFQFSPGDTVASSTAPDYPRKFTASYIANIAKAQEAGIYVSTLTYLATAGF